MAQSGVGWLQTISKPKALKPTKETHALAGVSKTVTTSSNAANPSGTNGRIAAKAASLALFALFALQFPILPGSGALPTTAVALPGTYTSPGFGIAGTPAFTQYESFGKAAEPTFGVAWHLGKGTSALYENGGQVRLDWDDSIQPPPAGGPPMTATDVTSPFNAPLNFDPILYTNPETGRTFAGGLVAAGTFLLPPLPPPLPSPPPVGVGCSVLQYTDDNGVNWVPMTDPCSMPGWDHETIGSGPWADPAPLQATYPAGVYYCSQDVLLAGYCWVSYDGGLSFVPTSGQLDILGCGTLHGHIRVSRLDGTAYLPQKRCGAGTGFAVTENNGDSWDQRVVSPGSAPTATGTADPSIGISIPESMHEVPPGHVGSGSVGGVLYIGQGEEGTDPGAYIAVSRDHGITWDDVGQGGVNGVAGSASAVGVKYFNVGKALGIRHATFADVIAGDDDRAAFSFMGTLDNDAPDYCGSSDSWDVYVAFTYDRGKSWTVSKATPPGDYSQVGGIWPYGGGPSCRNLLDFGDIVTDYHGRVLVTYEDGCTPTKCGGGGGDTEAAIWRQTTGRGLFKAYDYLGYLNDIPAPGDVCKPIETPQVTFTSPLAGETVTVANPAFAGIVDRQRVSPPIVGHANGDYFGHADAEIPLVAGADCFGARGYTCRWSDDLDFAGRPTALPLVFSNPTKCGNGQWTGTGASTVRATTAGDYRLILKVTDPVDGRTSTVTGLLHATLECAGQDFNSVVLDLDPLGDQDTHAAPAEHPSGVNDIVCFGAHYTGYQFEFQLQLADYTLPTSEIGSTAQAAEIYWITMSPTFGPYAGQAAAGIGQTLEVFWGGPTGDSFYCWVAAKQIVDPRGGQTRPASDPEACDPARSQGPISWAGTGASKTLEIYFPMSDLGSPTSGSRLENVNAWAWHAPGDSGWNSPGLDLGPLNGAGPGQKFHDDDFSPDPCNRPTPGLRGLAVGFTSARAITLVDSCNPLYLNWLDHGGPFADGPLAPPAPAPAPPAASSLPFGTGTWSNVAVPATPPCAATPTEYAILVGSWSVTTSPALPVNTTVANSRTWVTSALPPLSSADNGPQIVLAAWCGTDVNGKTAQLLATQTQQFFVAIQDLHGPMAADPPATTPKDTHGTTLDTDKDGFLDNVDDCPIVFDPAQKDGDSDGIGDACDPDLDNDGVPNNVDNCPTVPNPDHRDMDHDQIGDRCDPDVDGDGRLNGADNCPFNMNPLQTDSDKDGIGDACQGDRDGDGVPDYKDYFPDDPSEAADTNHNGVGDNAEALLASRGVTQSAKVEIKAAANPGLGLMGFSVLGLAALALVGIIVALVRGRRQA